MSAGLEALSREYASALERYVEARDEPTLSCAYELGRRAMTDGLGVLDLAVLHQIAIKALVVPASDTDRERLAEDAANFFRELLAPFEMSLRGYRAANDELRRVNETLERQREAVEIANRELESFSYSVSHDLRAPLRHIDGFSQLLLEEHAAALNDEGKKYLHRVREGTMRMGQLIDDLLALARVTRTAVHFSEVDLSRTVRRIVDWLAASAPERSCHFEIEDGVVANGDERLLTVLLENLLGNAWKFTSRRSDATIAFGHEQSHDAVTYFVRDNGAGFDMAYTKKLFGAFQRLHSADQFEGTGIGLATAQRVVQRHGGRIWAEGKVGEGAVFYFTLGHRRDQ